MGSSKNLQNILVIHGPNLNMLGKRETAIYGKTSLSDINMELKKRGQAKGVTVTDFQSNHEGAIVDVIQKALGNIAGLIINPAAHTHTSIAIRDALLLLDVPIIEVHMSNIYRREPFRHHSMIAGIATGQITGMGVQSYYQALEALINLLSTQE